jgi:hypothetical protein
LLAIIPLDLTHPICNYDEVCVITYAFNILKPSLSHMKVPRKEEGKEIITSFSANLGLIRCLVPHGEPASVHTLTRQASINRATPIILSCQMKRSMAAPNSQLGAAMLSNFAARSSQIRRNYELAAG